MSVHELDAQADREERLEAQRAARAAARTGGTPTPAPLPTAPAIRPAPAPAVPFEVVGQLPGRGVGMARKPVPTPRQQLIDYAIANPGKWLRYKFTDGEPMKRPLTLANYCRKQQGGFVKGCRSAIRNGDFYLRYDRPTP